MRAILQLLLLACALLSLGAAPAPRYVYWIDLRRALLSTQDGKLVAGELDRAEQDLVKLEREIAENESGSREDLEARIAEADARLVELHTKRVKPLADDVRGLIKSLNDASKDKLILEKDRYDPINVARACDMTDWLIRRLEKPGKKPLPKKNECAVKFFFYVDIDRLKTEMRATATQRITLEALKDDRLREISTSTATQMTRLEMFQRYAEQEKLRKELERKTNARMTLAATAFIIKTARPMRGVLFLGDASAEKMVPSCAVTEWLIQLEHGEAAVDDVARDCSCVWLNRKGTKIRIARGCGA